MQEGSNVWLLCKGGAGFMPGVLLGPTYRDGQEFYEVQSPQGQVYSARPEHVYSDGEGRAMLRQKRAEQLLSEGYQIKLSASGVYRMVCPKRHGDGPDAGYILRPLSEGSLVVCSCPAYAQSEAECRAQGGDPECKHTLGLSGLLLALASQAAQQGKAAHVQTYLDLAADPSRIRTGSVMGGGSLARVAGPPLVATRAGSGLAAFASKSTGPCSAPVAPVAPCPPRVRERMPTRSSLKERFAARGLNPDRDF